MSGIRWLLRSNRSRTAVLLDVAVVAGTLAFALLGLGAASAAASVTPTSGLGARGIGPTVPSKAVAMTRLWTEDSRTYKQPEEGPYTTIFYSQAVNAKGPDGHWKPIEGAESAEGATGLPPNGQHIDASTTLGAGQDCPIESNKASESLCTSTSDKVGWDGVDTDNTLIQFNIKEALAPDANVLNAQLGMYLSGSSTSNGVSVSAYALLKPWTTSATWNTYDGTHAWAEAGAEKVGGDYTTTNTVLNPSVVAPAGWAHWYPTQIVQEWANGTLENHGLVLADTTQRKTNDALTFNSSKSSGDKPYLTISWTPRGQEDPTAYTMQPFPIDESSTMKVNLASGDLFVNSNDLSVTSSAGPPLLAEHNYDSRNEEGGSVNPWYSLPGASVYHDGSVAIGINRYDFEPFILQSNGTFLTPRAIEATMCKVNGTTCTANKADKNGATYALTFTHNGNGPLYREGDKMTFSSTGGVLSVEDTSGHGVNYNFGSKGIESLSNTIEGRSLKRSFTKLLSGFEATSAWKDETTKHEVSYVYNSDSRLETYTDAESHKTKYAYESGSGLLKEITAPSGTLTKLFYTADKSRRVTKIEGAESNGAPGPWEYTYYEVGKAPTPCTASQKAVSATSPERGGLYCSNAFDEVEKTHELRPPLFAEFETSAYDESAASPTILYFSPAVAPPLPDGAAGPEIATYTYRYSVNGGPFSSWAQTFMGEVEVPHLAPGVSITMEVYAADAEGNVSATVSASAVVPPIPEGNGIGEESTEKDPSLEQEPAEQGESVEMSDSEEDSAPPMAAPLMPASAVEKRSEIIHLTGVRNTAGAFIEATATPADATHAATLMDVKAQYQHWYWGMFNRYIGACGWVKTYETKFKEAGSFGMCPAKGSINTDRIASLVNCNTCGKTWGQAIVPVRNSKGEPINVPIPVFQNVRPYANTESPHEKYTYLNSVESGKFKIVHWRYITRTKKYAMIAMEFPHNSHYTRWSFIEAKWLPETKELCHGAEPKLPESVHVNQHWPPVCSQH